MRFDDRGPEQIKEPLDGSDHGWGSEDYDRSRPGVVESVRHASICRNGSDPDLRHLSQRCLNGVARHYHGAQLDWEG
jgi:hypothetical protein